MKCMHTNIAHYIHLIQHWIEIVVYTVLMPQNYVVKWKNNRVLLFFFLPWTGLFGRWYNIHVVSER